jgi:hypothetical protein
VVFVRRSKSAAAHQNASLASTVGAKSWVGCVPGPVAKVVWIDSAVSSLLLLPLYDF